jgi:transposase-like protein
MRPSRVDDVGGVVLDALRDGASVSDAAARGGIPERTLRNWLREGRRCPYGRFAAFADGVDARRARLTVAAPAGSGELPSRQELRCSSTSRSMSASPGPPIRGTAANGRSRD